MERRLKRHFNWLLSLGILGGLSACSPTLNSGSPTPLSSVFANVFSDSSSSSTSSGSSANSTSTESGTTPSQTSGPFLKLVTYQAASSVIGQPDFTSAVSPTTPSNQTISAGWGVPTVSDGVLYIPDLEAHRILGFNSVPDGNQPAADFVLGQTDMTSQDAAPDLLDTFHFYRPSSVKIRDGKMLVLDGHGRVLIFDKPDPVNGLISQTVTTLGQDPDAGPSPSPTCDASHLMNDGPFGAVTGDMAFAGDKLLVTDITHDRVLVWNDWKNKPSGAPADMVIGQPNFTTCSFNFPNLLTPVPREAVWSPAGIWTDGTRLFISSMLSSQVLVWNTFPVPDLDGSASPPDFALGSAGQMLFDRGYFYYAMFLASNGTQLLVGNYVSTAVYDQLPTSSAALPDHVLAQPNFSSVDFVQNEHFFASGGMYLDGERLIVGDFSTQRYLIFKSVSDAIFQAETPLPPPRKVHIIGVQDSGTTTYPGDSKSFTVFAADRDGQPLEYQFYRTRGCSAPTTSAIVQPWSNSATLSYTTEMADIGVCPRIRVAVRNHDGVEELGVGLGDLSDEIGSVWVTSPPAAMVITDSLGQVMDNNNLVLMVGETYQVQLVVYDPNNEAITSYNLQGGGYWNINTTNTTGIFNFAITGEVWDAAQNYTSLALYGTSTNALGQTQWVQVNYTVAAGSLASPVLDSATVTLVNYTHDHAWDGYVLDTAPFQTYSSRATLFQYVVPNGTIGLPSGTFNVAGGIDPRVPAFEGDDTTISIAASDPNGLPLEYRWFVLRNDYSNPDPNWYPLTNWGPANSYTYHYTAYDATTYNIAIMVEVRNNDGFNYDHDHDGDFHMTVYLMNP